MISEGSCDTEDWRNDDKFSFDHSNKYIQIEHFELYLYLSKLYFRANKCSLGEQKILPSKTFKKNLKQQIEKKPINMCGPFPSLGSFGK